MVKVVVAHDYLTQKGGAERVVLAIMKAFPDARIVTSIYSPEDTFSEFRNFQIDTLIPRKVLRSCLDLRLAAPLIGFAFATAVVRDSDLLLCSSSGWSHYLRTLRRKVVYCHNPARWLYQPNDYFKSVNPTTRRMISGGLAPVRYLDRKRASSADLYIANSRNVQERIRRHYDTDSRVLNPPPGLDCTGRTQRPPGISPGFFLTVSRSRGYKNTTRAIDAFRGFPSGQLVIVGGGHENSSLPKNVSSLGKVSDDEMRWLYQNAQALIAIGSEDFGLTPVEAATFGTPVLALRSGGYLETVVDGVNGTFMDSDDVNEVRATLARFDPASLDRKQIIKHAENYSEDAFVRRLQAIASAA